MITCRRTICCQLSRRRQISCDDLPMALTSSSPGSCSCRGSRGIAAASSSPRQRTVLVIRPFWYITLVHHRIAQIWVLNSIFRIIFTRTLCRSCHCLFAHNSAVCFNGVLALSGARSVIYTQRTRNYVCLYKVEADCCDSPLTRLNTVIQIKKLWSNFDFIFDNVYLI